MIGKIHIQRLGFLLIEAIGLTGMSACSEAENKAGDLPRSARIIRLNTGITPVTRASLNSFSGETVAFAQAEVSGSYQATWPAVAEKTDTQLKDEHIYPANGSYLYLRGYYPFNQLVDGQSTYLLDGQTDLMATAEKAGNLTDNFSLESKTFIFYHLLTQVNIAVRLTNGERTGVRLGAIGLNGSRREAILELSAASLDQIPGVSFSGQPEPHTVYIEPSRYGGLLLTPEAATLPLAFLVEPAAALTLDVRLCLSPTETKVYNNLPVRFDEPEGISQAGTAYLITISLNVPEVPGADGTVSITADVTPWVEGKGSGIVQ